MTNLKGSSGTTGGAVQGPHSHLIFRLAWWSSNCLFGGPRTALQKAPFCRKKPFFNFLWSPNWLSGKVLSGPAGGCPAYIYIYVYLYIVCLVVILSNCYQIRRSGFEIAVIPVCNSVCMPKWQPCLGSGYLPVVWGSSTWRGGGQNVRYPLTQNYYLRKTTLK